MERRPRPIIGMVLGLLLAAIVVGLLWFTAVLPPSRFLVFLLAALFMVGVAGLTTRSVSAARGKFFTVLVLAGVLGGVAITGTPDLIERGSSSQGCSLEATAGGLTASPEDTSMWSRFTVAPDEVVTWSAATERPLAVDTMEAGVRVAGIDVPVRTVQGGGVEATAWEGTVDVAQVMTWVEDKTWLELSGVFEVTGTVSGESGECSFTGYVALPPAGLFSTNVLVGLWIALGVVLLLIAWAALAVRKSFKDAERAGTVPPSDDARDGVDDGVALGAATGVAGAAAGAELMHDDVPSGAAPEAEPVDERPISPYAPPVRRSAIAVPSGDEPSGDDAPTQVAPAPMGESTEVLPVTDVDAWAEPELEAEPEPIEVEDGADDVPEGSPWDGEDPAVDDEPADVEPADAEAPLDEPELDPEAPLDAEDVDQEAPLDGEVEEPEVEYPHQYEAVEPEPEPEPEVDAEPESGIVPPEEDERRE